jgi:hypothetical protein
MIQDPFLYALTCALRSDHIIKLIAYPYYAKFQKKGDINELFVLPFNPSDLKNSKRRANLIHSIINLDNEIDSDALYIIPSMHKRLP